METSFAPKRESNLIQLRKESVPASLFERLSKEALGKIIEMYGLERKSEVVSKLKEEIKKRGLEGRCSERWDRMALVSKKNLSHDELEKQDERYIRELVCEFEKIYNSIKK